MNARRFATMTGSLLARKGEASPTIVPEDPNAPIVWTNNPHITQTDLRVMAFPKREREVEPATMHHEWPEQVDFEPSQPMHDLREHAGRNTEPEPVRTLREVRPPIEPVRPWPEVREHVEPEPVRPWREVREQPESEPVRPFREVRVQNEPEPVRPMRVVRDIEPEPVRPAELGADKRSFFADQGGEKRHRISLGLTQEEHERLGIVAVKRGLTRHQLLRDALDVYFDKLANDYKSECACIATGGCRNGCDTDESA